MPCLRGVWLPVISTRYGLQRLVQSPVHVSAATSQYSSNNYIVLTTTACHTLPFTTPHPQLNSIFATSTFLFPDIDENIKAYTTGCVPAFWYVYHCGLSI